MAKASKKRSTAWKRNRDLNAELSQVLGEENRSAWARKTEFTAQPDGSVRRVTTRRDGTIEKDEIIPAEGAMVASAGMDLELKEVTIYTDGAAEPNPGPGGYGVVLLCGLHRKELSGGFARTTNNRMEILAAIVGLEALKTPCKVRLHSDSQYLVNAMTKGWARRWQAHGWKRNRHDEAVNPDLWGRLLTLCETHEVQFIWVKGHAGHRENERCDELAVQAAQQANLPADEGYEEPLQEEGKSQHGQPRLHGLSPEKVTREGQPCRKCSTPVVKKTPRCHKRKPGQSYYYEYTLHCSNCHTLYLVEDAKQPYEQQPALDPGETESIGGLFPSGRSE